MIGTSIMTGIQIVIRINIVIDIGAGISVQITTGVQIAIGIDITITERDAADGEKPQVKQGQPEWKQEKKIPPVKQPLSVHRTLSFLKRAYDSHDSGRSITVLPGNRMYNASGRL